MKKVEFKFDERSLVALEQVRPLRWTARNAKFFRAADEAFDSMLEIVRQNRVWVKWDAVKEGGWYWWWNGDEDAAPCPVSVMYSGTSGTFFATEGQLGWNRAQELSEMRGHWMRLHEPPTPEEGIDNRGLHHQK